MKKIFSLKSIFKLVLALFLIILFWYLCFSENGLIYFIKNTKGFSKSWLMMAFLCQIINLVIDVTLVYKFTNNINGCYKFKSAVKSSMVGQFFSAITPSASGGQPMQVFSMSRQGIDSGASTSALVQKFLVYQNVLTTYSAICILLRFDYFSNLNRVVWFFAILGFCVQAIVIVALFFFSFNQAVTYKIIHFIFILLSKLHLLKNPEEKINNLKNQLNIFHRGNKELYKNTQLVLETYVLTAIQLTSMFLIPYCIYRAFHFQGQPAIDMICAQSFIMMTSALFPIPGASGAAEVASTIFLNPFFSESTIKSAVALSRFITYYFTIMVSAPFSYSLRKKELNK